MFFIIQSAAAEVYRRAGEMMLVINVNRMMCCSVNHDKPGQEPALTLCWNRPTRHRRAGASLSVGRTVVFFMNACHSHTFMFISLLQACSDCVPREMFDFEPGFKSDTSGDSPVAQDAHRRLLSCISTHPLQLLLTLLGLLGMSS